MDVKPRPPRDRQPGLHIVPASAEENARIGRDGSAVVDYQLNPPPGMAPAQGITLGPEALQRRREALGALIDKAFGP